MQQMLKVLKVNKNRKIILLFKKFLKKITFFISLLCDIKKKVSVENQ